jgi:hypothetical protein
LKANIEGGENFYWYYNDGANDGPGLDPNGSGQYVSLPEGDRVAQNRQRYYPGQELLANKQLRWWWNNPHYAIYDDSDGNGWIARGPSTPWAPNAKPILFLEYGVPSVDKATNQPNVFFDPKSTESFTAYWSAWDSAPGLTLQPHRDDTLSSLALQAIYDYWNTDTPANNQIAGGVPMLQFAFCCVWNWDARPFPTFPLLSAVWGDSSQWQLAQRQGSLHACELRCRRPAAHCLSDLPDDLAGMECSCQSEVLDPGQRARFGSRGARHAPRPSAL